jgi:class 3 adenylate cyclase
MLNEFVEKLQGAQGRSDFVIAVVADIRGFSEFSTRIESPNIAMFIKRFYLQLVTKYFSTASFVKPTGDGLLMTFRFTEHDLSEVSKSVLDSCLQCLMDFPKLCENDPMINFRVPDAIGFGIARGTACCLFSGDEILDYSGHLLNLASRLNDLARPSGLVIDGGFLQGMIPEQYRSSFSEAAVYIRSIAEEEPIRIFYLDGHVHISSEHLQPLKEAKWRTVSQTFTVRQVEKLAANYVFYMPTRVRPGKFKVTVYVPRGGMKGMNALVYPPAAYHDEGTTPNVRISLDVVKERAAAVKSPKTGSIEIKIDYVARDTQPAQASDQKEPETTTPPSV